MDLSIIELDEAHSAIREDIRAFMTTHITDEVLQQEREVSPGYREEFHRALGERGWIMPEWPVERGGAGWDKLAMRIFELEKHRSGFAWVTLGTTRIVVPAIEQHASDAIRDDVLSGIASGSVRICLGYTEPQSGSDIAGARTRAVRDGDGWVINGSKIFTTGAQNCQYTFLITRTDPELPKHKGLTMFLVPLDSPGIEIQPIRAFSGEMTNIVYYDNVRVSDDFRMGEVNGGWGVLHGPLDKEHSIGRGGDEGLDDLSVGSGYVRELHHGLMEAARWARTTDGSDGGVLADDPLVVSELGEVAIEILAAQVTPGPLGRVKGSIATTEGAARLHDLVGARSLISMGQDGGLGSSAIDFAHRYAQGAATYGGTIEVFRNIIAQHYLGLPKPSYPGSKTLTSRAAQ